MNSQNICHMYIIILVLSLCLKSNDISKKLMKKKKTYLKRLLIAASESR